MSKKELVYSAVYEADPVLQRALRQEYSDRYPFVCGPAGIVLPRMPQLRSTGFRLGLGEGERFEIAIGIFNPDDSSGLKPNDHTYLRCYTDEDKVLFIDPIYPLIWGENTGQPIVEEYSVNEIDQALEEKYHLVPFTPGLAQELNLDLWGNYPPPKDLTDYWTDYCDMRTAMHDDRAFADRFEADSGIVRDGNNWAQRTTRVLRAVGGTLLASV